jgi:hypothetical protein
MMDLQDFACACCDLMWGGELAWDQEGGLEKLFNEIKHREKQRRDFRKIIYQECKHDWKLDEGIVFDKPEHHYKCRKCNKTFYGKLSMY